MAEIIRQEMYWYKVLVKEWKSWNTKKGLGMGTCTMSGVEGCN